MKIKNKNEADKLVTQNSDLILRQITYFAGRYAKNTEHIYDDLYSDTLLYVYQQIGAWDYEKATIQTYVSHLAQQGIKRFFQNMKRIEHHEAKVMSSITGAFNDEKPSLIDEVEMKAVAVSFEKYLDKNNYTREKTCMQALRENTGTRYVEIASVLGLSISSFHRAISSLRYYAAKWMGEKKVRFA